jgi:hypothetical protein
MAVKQLEGIGSSLSVPTKDGRIMSLADGLATALQRYIDAKDAVGLHALLLGGAEPDLAKTDFVNGRRRAERGDARAGTGRRCPSRGTCRSTS